VITPQQAVQFLQDAAALGDTHALVELGLCYYSGRWVSGDPARAIQLWKEAAQKGNREAEVRIAVARVRDEGNDLQEQIRILSKAMAEGSVLAEVALGYCHETGTGVPRNVPEAVELYRAAASRGSQDAYRALRRMHDVVRPAGKEFELEE